MNIFRITIFLSLVLLFSTHADNAYAQFWRKWFQKDQQQEQPIRQEPAKEPEYTGTQAGADMQELPEGMEEAEGMHVEIWTAGEPKETAEQAAKDVQAAPQAVPKAPGVSPTQVIDEKQKEEELRRTQEQVDQIKKLQEMNNMQRSLDNIKRINEMNQQQRRIDEINRLNRMQKNLDELRRTIETKK